MMTKWALVGLAAFALAGCDKAEKKAEAPVRPVLSTIAKKGAAEVQVFAGTIEPQVTSGLGFQALGRMIAREVSVGDQVHVGQVLARLDSFALEFAVRNAEAALSSRRAELANALATANRQTTLREGGVAPDSNVESAQNARDSAAAAVTKAETDLTKAREQLGYSVLKADFDGIVTATDGEVGQVVSAGQSVVTIARAKLRDAVIDLPDWISFNLSVGAKVSIALQVEPSIKVEGTVREIAPQSDQATRTRRVRIGLIDPPESFRLGTTVNVILPTGAPEGIVLPTTAILKDGDKSFVWVVDAKAGTVSRRAVATGDEIRSSAGPRVTIRDGLSVGERVATAGVHSLTDGQKVKIEGATP
jgi:RND family efflux transporter MFP subunit